MKRLQFSLSVLILLEVIGLFFLRQPSDELAPLPVTGAEHVFSKATVDDIRTMETGMDRGKPGDWLQLAETYKALGMYPAAEYCFQQADHLSPANNEHLFYWANCLSRMGKLDEARKKFEQVLAGGTRYASYCWLRLGQDRLRLNQPKEAERMFENAGDNAWAKLHLARLMIRSGRAAKALIVLEGLLQQYPHTMRAVQMTSWAYERLGNEKQAARYRQMAQHSPELIQPNFPNSERDEQRLQQLGSIRLHMVSGKYHTTGDLDSAITAGQQAISLYWRENYALHLAQLHTASNPDRAIELLQECNRRVGPNVLSLEMLGDAWAVKGDSEKARQLWEQATAYRGSRIASMTSNISLQTKLAQLASQQGDKRKSRRHTGLAHYERGRLAWRDNKLKDAMQSFEKAVQLLEDHAPSWFYLGQTRRLLKVPNAKAAYQRCLQLDPNHGRCLRAVQE